MTEAVPRPPVADWARLAGLGLIATGGLFGTIEDGILEDLLPAAAGSLLFILSFIGPRRVEIPTGFWWFLPLIALSVRAPIDLRESVSLAGAAIAFLAGANLRSDDAARRVLLGAALMLGAIALYQRFILAPEIIPLLEGEARGRLEVGRLFSTFVLPAQFGAYLALTLPPALAETTIGRHRRVATGILLLLVTCLLLNGTFSAILAAGGAIFFLLGAGRRAVIALLVLTMMATGIFFHRHEGVLHNLARPVAWRFGTWRGAIAGMAEAPLLGHGPDSFPAIYNSRFRPASVHATRHPHSWPVKIGFEHGAVGLAAFLLLWSVLLSSPRDRSWRAAAIAFGIAMFLDVADHSVTLRALGLFTLGASLKRRTPASRLGQAFFHQKPNVID